MKKLTENFPDETENRNKENGSQYRLFNLYVILICSILIFVIGIYVMISPQISEQYDWMYDFPNHIGYANGPFLIIIGVILSVFPLYHLFKNR